MEIKLGDKLVVPVEAEKEATVCKECCFAVKGQSTRTCPRVLYLDGAGMASRNLCVVVGNEKLTYFKLKRS